MRKLMSTTALAMTAAFGAQAQETSVSIGTNGYVGTTLLPSGMSSSAALEVTGFGSGGVVVSNSGLNLVLNPEYDADADTDFLESPSDSNIFGSIEVANVRSVEVSGVLSGLGEVRGSGTTTTEFDAQIIAGAESGNEGALGFGEDGSDGVGEASFTQEMTGLARLAGESTSTAGFRMVGQKVDFLGELGTTVGGNFLADAGFETDNDTDSEIDFGEIASGEFNPGDDDFEIEADAGEDDFNGINIQAVTRPIDLAIANLGGGTMLLTGSNSDLFEGGTLLTNEAAFDLMIGADSIGGGTD